MKRKEKVEKQTENQIDKLNTFIDRLIVNVMNDSSLITNDTLIHSFLNLNASEKNVRDEK